MKVRSRNIARLLLLLLMATTASAAQATASDADATSTDVIVYGGFCAAIAAAREGASVSILMGCLTSGTRVVNDYRTVGLRLCLPHHRIRDS